MGQASDFTVNRPVLDRHARYAAIIGRNPSQGARSPILWNAVFRELGIDAEMVPMDVPAAKLPALLRALQDDLRFMGGAIAIPHKEAVCAGLAASGHGRISQEARAIGAVNCLYRNEQRQLCATNTDGEGALRSLLFACGDLSGKIVLVIGLGGAGKAVAAYVARAVGKKGRVVLSFREPRFRSDLAAGITAQAVDWPPPPDMARSIEVVINCTTIGTGPQAAFTPLAALTDDNERISEQWLSGLRPDATVFDIIYDPAPSKLLRLATQQGFVTLDGGLMNLEQAVLAFHHAQGISPGLGVIHDIMASAKDREMAF